MATAAEGGGAALLEVFDHIYVINLPARTDRRADSARSFRRIGLGHDHPQVTVFPAIRPEARGEFPSVGARGCFLSHMTVLERALAAGHGHFLIMEDDADFSPRFGALMPPLAAALAGRDWGMLYGWNPDRHGLPPDGSPPRWIPLDPARPVTMSHFIGLSRDAAARALPCLSGICARPFGHPEGGAMHVDGAYNWFRRAHPEIEAFAASEALALQRPSRTDIHPLPWWDRLPVARSLAAAFRRVRALRRG